MHFLCSVIFTHRKGYFTWKVVVHCINFHDFHKILHERVSPNVIGKSVRNGHKWSCHFTSQLYRLWQNLIFVAFIKRFWAISAATQSSSPTQSTVDVRILTDFSTLTNKPFSRAFRSKIQQNITKQVLQFQFRNSIEAVNTLLRTTHKGSTLIDIV